MHANPAPLSPTDLFINDGFYTPIMQMTMWQTEIYYDLLIYSAMPL